ncbi:MAG TPA: response regulator [Pyrinomonadaceae bacterium]|nr:response regulator [Pyrinomonadaceae bacterium]
MKLEFESNTSTLPYTARNYANGSLPENNAALVSEMLRAGVKAAQAGNRSEARQLLTQVTEAEPDNETAWLWMASISEYPEELIIFLNNVLSVNPNNARALEWMRATKSLLANTFVQRGVEALTDANQNFAKQCFWQAIAHDDQNETAWLSLASASDSTETKITYLQKVVNINPGNESAKASLQAAKKQAAESLLRKANSAAVAGNREEAREMLQEVLEHSPELEEAWILKSYLAESFSEKITCFEKVLKFNPENEMAISGIASLRAMMAKTEAKKVEQAARIAEFDKRISESRISDFTEEKSTLAEADAEENSPTQKLEFPPDFMPAEHHNQNSENTTADPIEQSLEFPDFENAHENYSVFFQEQEPISMETTLDESPVNLIDSAENDYMNYTALDNESPAADTATNSNFMDNYKKTPTSPFTGTYSESENGFHLTAKENLQEDYLVKSSVVMADCPFCSAENDSNAFICRSCRAILTLSDLEMLLAQTEADQQVLRNAVKRLEIQENSRVFSANELKNLAIGQINLKNLRQGVVYLQKAAHMNPNDVMLASQVNSLKIRLSEIEQQENNNSQMQTGRKILIVDDSATVRKLISSKLEKSGHEVVSAVDGIDALEKIKEFLPDLILLDIMMPQLDGYQVCKLIRNNELTKDVPIVMISGKDGFFDKVRGRMAGTTGYITKPFGPETLMKAIETYIVHRGEMVNDEEIEN